MNIKQIQALRKKLNDEMNIVIDFYMVHECETDEDLDEDGEPNEDGWHGGYPYLVSSTDFDFFLKNRTVITDSTILSDETRDFIDKSDFDHIDVDSLTDEEMSTIYIYLRNEVKGLVNDYIEEFYLPYVE